MREDNPYRRVRRSWSGGKVLNVQNEVQVNVLEDLKDHSETGTSQLTRDEVEQAAKKLQNGKAAGKDEMGHGAV